MEIRFTGRWAFGDDPAYPKANFPGSGFEAGFTGTAVSATLVSSSADLYFMLVVDGAKPVRTRFSFGGFRPRRSQHDALDALAGGLMRKKVNWVLDADIRGFFDAINHEWLVMFFEHRIADKKMGRLVKKWLAAGVLEDGKWTKSEVGTPQGATASPLLANLYLHYVLDSLDAGANTPKYRVE